MKSVWTRYLNEIVGLAVMALMAIALIAGQAQATAGSGVLDDMRPVIEISVTISE